MRHILTTCFLPNDDSGVDLTGHHGKRRDDSHEMLAVGSDSFG